MNFALATLSTLSLALAAASKAQARMMRSNIGGEGRGLDEFDGLSLSLAMLTELAAEMPSHKNKQSKSQKSVKCNPKADVVLADYPQWQDETGYFLGEYSLYGPTGDAFVSSWPYPYLHYKGFITGNVESNAYRQRNVFLYPNLPEEICETKTPNVIGDGMCGENGNTKVFFADQNATTCDSGDLEGDYGSYFKTTTDLIGPGNAVLYQVFLKAGIFGNNSPPQDCLYQSQLTTFTRNIDGKLYRTRTAQGFHCFVPSLVGQTTFASYYREHKVEKDVFYKELEEKLLAYNILQSDMCAWKDGATGGVVPSGYTPGVDGCKEHLEQSFEDFA